MASMKMGADMGHIYLTGMMGSGKSAIGRALAKKLQQPFMDIDALIEKDQNRKISEIFAQDGEAFFRTLETQALRALAEEEKAKVVSCGGGIVLSDENVRIMRESGTIVLIFRNVDKIVQTVNTKKRPLLKEGAENVRKIYEERAQRYEESCDIRIENSGTIPEAANKIISLLKRR